MNQRTVIPSDIEFYPQEHILNLLKVVASERDEFYALLQQQQEQQHRQQQQQKQQQDNTKAVTTFPSDVLGFHYHPTTDTQAVTINMNTELQEHQQQPLHAAAAAAVNNNNNNNNMQSYQHLQQFNNAMNGNGILAVNNMTHQFYDNEALVTHNSNNVKQVMTHTSINNTKQQQQQFLNNNLSRQYHHRDVSDSDVVPSSFKVEAVKKRIAKKSFTLVKKTPHSRTKKPYTEIHEVLPNTACARILFEGFSHKSDTNRLIKWEFDGDQIIEWLGGVNKNNHNKLKYIHPVKFEGKVLSFPINNNEKNTGGGKPFVYAWAKYVGLQAKFDKKCGSIHLKFRTTMVGSGRPKNGSDVPPSWVE